MAQWGVRRHARKTSSTGCEQVEKAGWTGSDGCNGDRHALVLCDFLPYPVQFANNNCHPRSHEVEAAAGTHRDPPRPVSFLVHTGAVTGEAAPCTLQPWLQRGDTMRWRAPCRSPSRTKTRRHTPAAQSSSFGLLDLDGSPTHDCYGDGVQPPLVPRGAHLW